MFFRNNQHRCERVNIGWLHNSTNGFDEDIDVDLPNEFSLGPPGQSNNNGDAIGGPLDPIKLPGGSFVSEGLDSAHRLLTTDIRPFGENTAWYLYIDLGENPSSVTLNWGSVELTVNKPLQLREVNAENGFVPLGGQAVNMRTENSFEIQNPSQFQRKVFLVQIGSISDSINLTLYNGWNLISMPINPTDPNPESVFADNAGKVFIGNVWGYDIIQEGQTVPTTNKISNVRGGKGYWVYSNRPVPVSLTIKGSTVLNSLDLRVGWNLVGPTTITAEASFQKSLLADNGTMNIPADAPLLNDRVKFWFRQAGDNGGQNYTNATSTPSIFILKKNVGYWIYSPREQSIALRERN